MKSVKTKIMLTLYHTKDQYQIKIWRQVQTQIKDKVHEQLYDQVQIWWMSHTSKNSSRKFSLGHSE
jgi:hypothetical protein